MLKICRCNGPFLLDLRRKALLKEHLNETNVSCEDTESPISSFDSDYGAESRDEDTNTIHSVPLRNKNVVVSQMLEDATGKICCCC